MAEADQLLSRFPGPVTLYPARMKWLVVLLVTSLFTAAASWMVSRGVPNGWLALALAGPGWIASAIQLVPGTAALTLDGDGFEVKAWALRRRSRWADVTRFIAKAPPGTRTKVVFYSNRERKNAVLGKINALACGDTAALPDTYGVPADDLARLMSLWRDRATQHQGTALSPPSAQRAFGVTGSGPCTPLPE